MKILGVDHIGVAVNNIDDALKFYEDILGISCVGREEVEEQKVVTAFLPVGDTEIELLESTSPEGPIAKFIERNGGKGGMQHVALRVESLEEAIAEMLEKGMQMIDEKPRYGAGGARIAFVHPRSSGILLELCEKNK